MKKIILSILALSSYVSQATVTVNGVVAAGLVDETSALLPADQQVLVLVVVDTGGDSFSSIQDGAISVDSFIGSDGNDYIVNLTQSSNTGGLNTANGNLILINTEVDDPSSPVSLGDDFILYWFPDLDGSTTSLSAGDTYGQIRGSDWVLPTGDGDTINITPFVNNIAANAEFFTVVPEPSSTTLLGLGGLALLARRRRA